MRGPGSTPALPRPSWPPASWFSAPVAWAPPVPRHLPCTGRAGTHGKPEVLDHFENVVVIDQEYHSFDNLYGAWGKVDGHKVEGVADAPASRTTQVAQDGSPYGCLLQNDVNLTSPTPLPTTLLRLRPRGAQQRLHEQAVHHRRLHRPMDTTCPIPKPGERPPVNGVPKGSGAEGGCTRDLVHRFFLNHQWLIPGRAPVDTKNGSVTPVAANSVVDANGMPTNYPLYPPLKPAPDPAVQPASAPFGTGAKIPLIDDKVHPDIGDRMTRAGSRGTGTPAAGTTRTTRPRDRARCSSTTTSRSTTSPTTPRASPAVTTSRTRPTSSTRQRTAPCRPSAS